MEEYLIYFDGDEMGRVSGVESAYHAFRLASELGSAFGKSVFLVSGETGEIIANSSED